MAKSLLPSQACVMGTRSQTSVLNSIIEIKSTAAAWQEPKDQRCCSPSSGNDRAARNAAKTGRKKHLFSKYSCSPFGKAKGAVTSQVMVKPFLLQQQPGEWFECSCRGQTQELQPLSNCQWQFSKDLAKKTVGFSA